MLGRVWGPTRFIPATGGCAGLPKALAISRALVYAPRVWVGVDDMTQASRRLALAHPTTRLPDYRAPLAASLSANPVAADRSALVLTAAPVIRVAHTRRAAVPRTADHVCRNASARPTAADVDRHRHQSTPPGAAGSKLRTTATTGGVRA